MRKLERHYHEMSEALEKCKEALEGYLNAPNHDLATKWYRNYLWWDTEARRLLQSGAHKKICRRKTCAPSKRKRTYVPVPTPGEPTCSLAGAEFPVPWTSIPLQSPALMDPEDWTTTAAIDAPLRYAGTGGMHLDEALAQEYGGKTPSYIQRAWRPR